MDYIYIHNTYLVFKLCDELLVTRHHVRTILYQAAESPQPECGFTILLDDIKVLVVHPTAFFSGLLDNSVDSLAKWVVQDG
jgi:hypothetical protein